ncbi:hypothetical protein T439DRAFT_348493 [Meredithblackwellia eburnea MCA 4105]
MSGSRSTIGGPSASTSTHRSDASTSKPPPGILYTKSELHEDPLLRDLRLTLHLSYALDAQLDLQLQPLIEDDHAMPAQVASKTYDLPLEITDAIVAWSQADGDNPNELRRLSLVSKVFARSARKALFRSIHSLLSTSSLMRLRSALSSSPELSRHVRKVDLSNPNCRWEPNLVSEFFRRASGLLRETPLVHEISILHIALSDNVRRRLFGALSALRIKKAIFDASCWSNSSNHRPSRDTSLDMDAFIFTLTRWSSLKVLSLHGYNLYPRVICPSSLPLHSFPKYNLRMLDVASCDLNGSILLWLLGSSNSSLRQLNLSNVTGLTLDVLETALGMVGKSLVELQITLDQDDFTPAQPPRSINPKVFSSLVKLKTLVISTDMETTTLLDEIAHLPLLSFLGLNCPTLAYSKIERFLQEDLQSLRDLSLDLWGDDDSWTCYTRFLAARACRTKGVDLLLDGCDGLELEDAWFGIGAGMDLSEVWEDMERLDWPVRKQAELAQ